MIELLTDILHGLILIFYIIIGIGFLGAVLLSVIATYRSAKDGH